MSERRKLYYEAAAVELVEIDDKDVIATSTWKESTDQVDKEDNSWVPIIGGWN